jgi:tetratricopeptide (TPR) repeat protein
MGGMLRTAMSRILEIAADIFWLAIIIGGGGWLFIRSVKASEDPKKITSKWLVTIALVVGEIFFARHLIKSMQPGDMLGNFVPAFMLTTSIAACGVTLAVIWGSHIGGVIAKPLSNLYDGGGQQIEPKPYYSIAMSKRKMNKPLEAIVAIREQLAKFPKDFEGVTLLANIQAEDMKDLPSAEITFEHFCKSPDTPDRQVVAAWTQMADWHLKIAQDADSARAALEKIITKFPDSPFSAAAAQRIAHLGGAEKILLAAHDRQPMFVPEGVSNIGLLDSTEFLQPSEADPAQLAADYVKHLAQHPQDTDAREKLAVIYAEHYQRLDLATMELNQLIEQPNQPPKRVVHWLNLLANLQFKCGADCDTVRGTLEKIVERFPGQPAAEIAQSRLARLNLEFKGKEKTPGKKLGVYEQNVGLKYGSPYRSPREL